MKKIPLTPEMEENLKTLVKSINSIADIFSMHPDTPIDNSDFIRVMHISKRTAQDWRDKKVIPYIKIRGKIYYQVKDIKALLEKHYHRFSV